MSVDQLFNINTLIWQCIHGGVIDRVRGDALVSARNEKLESRVRILIETLHSLIRKNSWERHESFSSPTVNCRTYWERVDNHSKRIKSLNSNQPGMGWTSSGYFIQGTQLMLHLQYRCRPYDQNGLWDRWLWYINEYWTHQEQSNRNVVSPEEWWD